jgi:hypothetical protein
MRTRAVRTYNFFANFSVAKCGHIISETLSSDLFARVAQPTVRRSGLPSAVGWPSSDGGRRAGGVGALPHRRAAVVEHGGATGDTM